MDVVYTLRHDRHSGIDQLLYSLRSLEKYVEGVDQVIVVGVNPKLKGVVHIPHADNRSPALNIFNKLLTAAKTNGISKRFLYIADDHYLAAPVVADSYPYYRNNTLPWLCLTQRNAYKNIISNTMNALSTKGKDMHNFNVHCPIVYEKERLIELSGAYKFPPMGYVLKSLYCNHFEIPSEIMTDCKIRTNFEPEEIKRRIAGRPVWSSGREWQCANIGKLLREFFPDKSKWE